MPNTSYQWIITSKDLTSKWHSFNSLLRSGRCMNNIQFQAQCLNQWTTSVALVCTSRQGTTHYILSSSPSGNPICPSYTNFLFTGYIHHQLHSWSENIVHQHSQPTSHQPVYSMITQIPLGPPPLCKEPSTACQNRIHEYHTYIQCPSTTVIHI